MGMQNMRAICPQCGTKIHTEASAWGVLALGGRSGPMTRTGLECPGCGLALSGKVGFDGNAIAADDPRLAAKRVVVVVETDMSQKLLDLLADEGPQTTKALQEKLGLSNWQLSKVETSLGRKVLKFKGFGPKRIVSLKEATVKAA
jgi:hypothetical protein